MKEIEIPLLETEAITMRFGGVTAVNGLSIEVNQEIVALIGPNGAGKTTAFNMITGVYTPTEGRIMFEGEILQEKAGPNYLLGIARTFQNIRLLRNYPFWKISDCLPSAH